MNRKLHHTVMALSATATVFTLLVLAGTPVPTLLTPAPLLVMAADSGSGIEGGLGSGTPQAVAIQRRHQRHSRALLALPYFSFAQGLRRNRS